MWLAFSPQVDVYKNAAGKQQEATTPSSTVPAGVRSQRLGRLGGKSFFGEHNVLNQRGAGTRLRTVVARTTCQFAVLDKVELDHHRKKFPVGCALV